MLGSRPFAIAPEASGLVGNYPTIVQIFGGNLLIASKASETIVLVLYASILKPSTCPPGLSELSSLYLKRHPFREITSRHDVSLPMFRTKFLCTEP